MRHITLISFGSNDISFWGSAAETVRIAMDEVARFSKVDAKRSRFYATPAFPKGAGPDFVNTVMAIETETPPDVLLAAFHGLEADAGRKRIKRWGQRPLDIDLIACGDLVLPDQKTYAQWRDLPLAAQLEATPDLLILPHPRLQDRAFVLVPLCDVAPDWVHPVSGKSVRAMCEALPGVDRAEVVPMTAPKGA